MEAKDIWNLLQRTAIYSTKVTIFNSYADACFRNKLAVPHRPITAGILTRLQRVNSVLRLPNLHRPSGSGVRRVHRTESRPGLTCLHQHHRPIIFDNILVVIKIYLTTGRLVSNCCAPPGRSLFSRLGTSLRQSPSISTAVRT